MRRQFPHRARASAARPVLRTGTRRTVTRSAAAVLATGLLAGLDSPLVHAQQSPNAWSAERRAVLPSGFVIQADFSPLPGVKSTAAPGKLAERAASAAGAATGAAPAYSDGIRPGDPAETFTVAEQRPVADGSWHTLGTLQLTFSRPVRNPRCTSAASPAWPPARPAPPAPRPG